MQFRFDPEANALYISLSRGEVARTIGLNDEVYVDVDAQGELLGIEFVNADEFIPFLRQAESFAQLPGADAMPALIRDRVRELFTVTATP
jgi:uncharacterized protein YuzE